MSLSLQIEDVLWSVTDECNLNCIYCSVAEPAGDYNEELSEAQIDRIVSQLQLLPRLKSIILSGGEAMLSPIFPYALRKAASLGSNIYVITNGVKLPPSAIAALREYRSTIMFSIDSTDETVNARTRGKGVLKNVIDTVGRVHALGIPIVIISVVTIHNIDTIIEDISFFQKHGIKNILLQQLHCEGKVGRELFGKLSPSPQQIERLYGRLVEFERRHPDVNIDYNEICFFAMRGEAYAQKCNPGLEYMPQRLLMCGAGFKFFAIKNNGDIIPCNALRSCVLGNLFREDITSILTSSEEMNNLRILNSQRVDSIPGCSNCLYNPVCDGGCRADALHAQGNLFGRHPYCSHHQDHLSGYI